LLGAFPEVVGEHATGKSLRAGKGRRALRNKFSDNLSSFPNFSQVKKRVSIAIFASLTQSFPAAIPSGLISQAGLQLTESGYFI
jgi:hypothetical protein